MKRLKLISLLSIIILLSACTGVRKDYPTPEPGYASKPSDHGTFAEMESAFARKHGTQKSGFLLLDKSGEALKWRLAFIDEAQHSLDVQYFLWYADDVGYLILKRCLDAANRGVRVRLIADGMVLIGEGKTHLRKKRLQLYPYPRGNQKNTFCPCFDHEP